MNHLLAVAAGTAVFGPYKSVKAKEDRYVCVTTADTKEVLPFNCLPSDHRIEDAANVTFPPPPAPPEIDEELEDTVSWLRKQVKLLKQRVKALEDKLP